MAQQKAVEMPVEDLDDLVDELAPGTKLLKGQYTITRYLNSGGFGITYLAKDSLDRNVVIKECFPSAFSRRSKTVVAARSRAHTAELRSVVQLFVKEARSLSKIVHPNIVAVHQVFEDNGTAYMAIDFVDGLDLQQIIEGQGPMPTPAEIVIITEKLLHAVGFIHAHDMLHRDISPDNVLISKDGEPVLIDFGAAREQASKSNRAMSALRVVKDGYSPQEFYIAGSDQGPWSDLYALGATLYHLISGEAPVNGQARLAALAEDRHDPYVKLDGRYEGYPPGFLAAIDVALATLPKQRVQSAETWLSLFTGERFEMPTGGLAPASRDKADSAVRAAMRSDTADGNGGGAGFGAPPKFAGQAQHPLPQSDAKHPTASSGGIGKVQVLAGIAATLALIGAGMLLIREDVAPSTVDGQAAVGATEAEAPVLEPAEVAVASVDPAPAPDKTLSASPAEAETVVALETAPVAAADPVVMAEPASQPEPVAAAEPVAAEPVAAEPVAAEPVAAEPVAAAEPESTVAEVAPAEAPAAAIVAPTGTLRENQVAFAAWDIALPFTEGSRIVDGQRLAIVQSVVPGVDLSVAGTWLEPGVRIHSVNGTDVQLAGSVATSVLNVMTVDPDGRARVVVEYSRSTQDRQTGLLTVDANRILSLGNGVNFAIRNIDGEWRTTVTGVTIPEATELRQGDILYRDKSTATALDGVGSLEATMAALVEQGVGVTEFSILRANKLETAAMQLVAD